MSGRTLEKARAVVAAAAAEPKRFGKLVEYMDETGRVDRAFKQIKIARLKDDNAKRAADGCTADDLVALAASGYRAGVIYADPAWPWDGTLGNGWSCADHFYGLSTLDKIKSVPVAALAADDCALLMWCTGPHIAIGSHVEVMKAWGFKPSTIAFTWIKTNKNDDRVRTKVKVAGRPPTPRCASSPPRVRRHASRPMFIRWCSPRLSDTARSPRRCAPGSSGCSSVLIWSFTGARRTSPVGRFGEMKFSAKSSARLDQPLPDGLARWQKGPFSLSFCVICASFFVCFGGASRKLLAVAGDPARGRRQRSVLRKCLDGSEARLRI